MLRCIAPVNEIKPPDEMSDSEVIMHMKQVKSWEKRVEDLVSELRKLQVEAIGIAEVGDMVTAVEQAVPSCGHLKQNLQTDYQFTILTT